MCDLQEWLEGPFQGEGLRHENWLEGENEHGDLGKVQKGEVLWNRSWLGTKSRGRKEEKEISVPV